MHINFATKKGFKFDLKTIKEFSFDWKEIRNLRLNRFNMVVIVVGVLFIMIVFGAFQKFRLDSYKKDLSRMEASLMEMKTNAAFSNVEFVSGSGKYDLIKNYENRTKWSVILGKIAQEKDDRSWLTSIASGDKAKNSLVISGEAADQAAVAGMLSSLKQMGIFKDVELVSSDTNDGEMNARTKINFTIDCELK